MNANDSGAWTIAWRKCTANRFQRATNWAGTWHEAVDMAGTFAEAHPEFQVCYVTSLAYERDQENRLPQEVADGVISQELADSYIEDHGNVMVDSGKRIKIVDNGVIPAELLPKMHAREDGSEVTACGKDAKRYGATPVASLVTCPECLAATEPVRPAGINVPSLGVPTATPDDGLTAELLGGRISPEALTAELFGDRTAGQLAADPAYCLTCRRVTERGREASGRTFCRACGG